jgi:AraC-like DNA-binding protein
MKVSETEIQTHLGCFNYNKYESRPLIELRSYKKGDTRQIVTEHNGIIVVLNGALNFSFERRVNKQVNEGTMVVLPIKHNYKVEITKDTTFIIFRLNIDFSFCDHFSIEALYREQVEKREDRSTTRILNINNVITGYMSHLITLLNDGLYCGYLLEIKLREFLYILRYYYPIQKLKGFFAPILSDDFKFSALVWENYEPNVSVSELAKITNYSISGFEKRFKKVFRVSPYQWVTSQKARAIYHEINCSTKTFAEMGYDFGFSSPAHFNNFCKKVFNETPGNIRKKR